MKKRKIFFVTLAIMILLFATNVMAAAKEPELDVNQIIIIICTIVMACCWMYSLLKSIPKPQNKKHDYPGDNEEDEDYIREDNEEDEDYVWDENEQNIKTAKERLQKLFPFTYFTVSESDIYDSYGRFDTIDGNTYELAEQSGLGYVAYVLFDRHTGKVIGLMIVAVIPFIFRGVFNASISFGGTSLIIIVSVVLETIKQVESMMAVKNYKGFLAT